MSPETARKIGIALTGFGNVLDRLAVTAQERQAQDQKSKLTRDLAFRKIDENLAKLDAQVAESQSRQAASTERRIKAETDARVREKKDKELTDYRNRLATVAESREKRQGAAATAKGGKPTVRNESFWRNEWYEGRKVPQRYKEKFEAEHGQKVGGKKSQPISQEKLRQEWNKLGSDGQASYHDDFDEFETRQRILNGEIQVQTGLPPLAQPKPELPKLGNGMDFYNHLVLNGQQDQFGGGGEDQIDPMAGDAAGVGQVEPDIVEVAAGLEGFDQLDDNERMRLMSYLQMLSDTTGQAVQ